MISGEGIEGAAAVGGADVGILGAKVVVIGGAAGVAEGRRIGAAGAAAEGRVGAAKVTDGGRTGAVVGTGARGTGAVGPGAGS